MTRRKPGPNQGGLFGGGAIAPEANVPAAGEPSTREEHAKPTRKWTWPVWFVPIGIYGGARERREHVREGRHPTGSDLGPAGQCCARCLAYSSVFRGSKQTGRHYPACAQHGAGVPGYWRPCDQFERRT